MCYWLLVKCLHHSSPWMMETSGALEMSSTLVRKEACDSPETPRFPVHSGAGEVSPGLEEVQQDLVPHQGPQHPRKETEGPLQLSLQSPWPLYSDKRQKHSFPFRSCPSFIANRPTQVPWVTSAQIYAPELALWQERTFLVFTDAFLSK